VVMTSPARQAIAATMAQPPTQTDWMAAVALAMKAGVEPAVTLMLFAKLRRTAAAMAQPKTRTQLTAVFASATSDGKVMLAKPK